ncbi:thioesterase II family protein [Streptomyces sp. MAR4 CNX-425]|uniref:thioesterase II family protein n=1 Tax=Streptomyces sp. MAR4 CNX-425 TaxID=3406343 RepID=UPI003B503446
MTGPAGGSAVPAAAPAGAAVAPGRTGAGPPPLRGGWFAGVEPADDGAAALRLVCFPYAGGAASAFRGWAPHLGGHVQVVPVLPPGRGLRLGEAPYTAMEPLVHDLADALLGQGLADDYAVFGHSMGALVAYEVCCELRRRGAAGPRHMFVAASRAPHFYGGGGGALLPAGELRKVVGDLGGLGPGGGVGDAYLERRLPVLRADLGMCEGYRWTPREPLDCPMTAFVAGGDPVARPAEVEAWREYAAGSFVRRDVPGGHFFLLGAARPRLWQEMRRDLARYRAPGAAADTGPLPARRPGPSTEEH